MSKRIAYLGPPGTFSEEAAVKYDEKSRLLPFSSVPAVAGAVDTGLADEGVVAIENSLEGSVTDTLDLLIHESRLLIRQELILPIEHRLLVKPGTEAPQIRVVFSHPQALAQCQSYLRRLGCEIIPAYDTAGSVKMIKDKKSMDGAA
ncbi:MAG: prephenate dehydratase, partial [Chloroflexi bacterium]|nr:prephenate dehydratase [Chloroflexota bacterium]